MSEQAKVETQIVEEQFGSQPRIFYEQTCSLKSSAQPDRHH